MIRTNYEGVKARDSWELTTWFVSRGRQTDIENYESFLKPKWPPPLTHHLQQGHNS